MNLIGIIERRTSVRTFNGLRPDENIMKSLRDSAERATDDLPECFANVKRPVLVIADNFSTTEKPGTYGVISGARSYVMMGYDKTPEAMLLAGYVFERFIISCTELLIGTCWLGGTFSHSAFQKKYDEESAKSTKAYDVGIVSPLGHATPRKRFAERMMRRVARSDKRKPFNTLFSGVEPPSERNMTIAATQPENRMPLTDAISIALEMVRIAPSSSNSQPWRGKVETNGDKATVTLTCTTSNRFSHIDMGIALYHFHATMIYLGYNADLTLGQSLTFNVSAKKHD